MQDQRLEEIYSSEEFKMFANDPKWFREAMEKTLFYDETGKVKHSYYQNLDENNHEEYVVITTLKHLRAVMPSSSNPIDEELSYMTGHLNGDSCILLTFENHDNLIEPISKLGIIDGGLQWYSEDENWEYMQEENAYIALNTINNIPPIATATKELVEKWKQETVPYGEELKDYLIKLKEKTNSNFHQNSIVGSKSR